jgi:hypothetical protein
MVFQNGVKHIQAAAYSGPRTVSKTRSNGIIKNRFSKTFCWNLKNFAKRYFYYTIEWLLAARKSNIFHFRKCTIFWFEIKRALLGSRGQVEFGS